MPKTTKKPRVTYAKGSKASRMKPEATKPAAKEKPTATKTAKKKPSDNSLLFPLDQFADRLKGYRQVSHDRPMYWIENAPAEGSKRLLADSPPTNDELHELIVAELNKRPRDFHPFFFAVVREAHGNDLHGPFETYVEVKALGIDECKGRYVSTYAFEKIE